MRARWRAVIAAAAVLVVLGGVAGWQVSRKHGPVPAALRDKLTARVVGFLEKDPEWRKQATEEPGWQPICGAYVFGLDPVDAHAVGQVHSIYAWVDCRWLPPVDSRSGGRATDLPGEVSPVAVRLGSPDTFEVPQDGEDRFSSDLDRIFPRDLRPAARQPDPAFATTSAQVTRRVQTLLA